MRQQAEIPHDVVHRLRSVCLELPEVSEEEAWVGTRWRIRRRTFAHVVQIAAGWPPAYARAARTAGPATVLTFRADEAERAALGQVGDPFFLPNWGRPDVGMRLGAAVDWDEVAELLTDSYRALAPRSLAARIGHPTPTAAARTSTAPAAGSPAAAGSPVVLRAATAEDVDDIAAIWHLGWRDGHLGNVPDELVAVRTAASFTPRAAERIEHTQVAVVDGDVAGFVVIVDDEVEQVYVAAAHRGSGVATALLTAAERQVATAGYPLTWLAVAPGNERARRFYARCGWRDEGPLTYAADGPAGPVPVPVRRYVKRLTS